jgi:predicted MFS family arabinose efflux permease
MKQHRYSANRALDLARQEAETLRMLAGGIIAMAIALGISRFAYTPLLPLMQQDLEFGDTFAGTLGSANYAGYLAGALWAAWSAGRERRVARLRCNLLLTVVSVTGMGLTEHPLAWIGLRFLSGTSSAMVFVLASGIVLEALAKRNRQAWSGWLYAGVGLGIALSALLVPLFDRLAGWQGGWLGLAAVCLLLAAGSWTWLPARESIAASAVPAAGPNRPQPDGFLAWLTLAYTLEGLGYIVTATFLVAWLQRSGGQIGVSYLAWLLVGLAAIPSCVLWIRASLRLGLIRTLIAAYLVQATGILLPLLIPTAWGALGGALCFGGTFLGIAAMTLVLGRTLDQARSDRVIAILTAAFGLGQMIGPAIAGVIADLTRSYTLPSLGAAGFVLLGAASLAIGLVRHPGPLTAGPLAATAQHKE